MVGMQYGDPHTMVVNMLTDYVRKELARDSTNIVAESMGHMLAGMRVSRLYRRDIAEPGRNVIAREFLRGILADHHVY